jgi:neurotransmitter:Na+ symporter, NSS family
VSANREQWGTSAGFILATIGSAVGIGNIWRFSYVAGENGGGAFLVVYALSVIFVGLPIVIGEMALGRRSGADAVAAFSITSPRSLWRHAGWLPVVGCILILSFYAVIAGWALKYFIGSVTGTLWHAAGAGFGGYFRAFIAGTGEPLSWQLAILAVTMFVVAGGVRSGIETANRFLMPDWGAVLQGSVLVAAVGQAFFSIGVGMAVFITYASYLGPATRLPRSAVAIVAGDTLFAVVAGLAIFPAVFAFGMDPRAGPELAFITLPQIFLAMPGGKFVGAVFFGLLVAAAMTSMVSLLEVPVACLVHRTRMGRRRAVALIGTIAFVLGIPSALSFGLLSHVRYAGAAIFDLVDGVVSNYLLPAGGILVCLYVGWHLTGPDARAAAGLDKSVVGVIWLWLVRVVAPATIILVFLDVTGAF